MDVNVLGAFPPVKVIEDFAISSSEGVHSYGYLICHVAGRLGISTSQAPKVVDDVVFNVIQSQLTLAVAIPLTKVMFEMTKSTWVKPSFPISLKRLNHTYQTQKETAEFLFHHPALNSLDISSSSKGAYRQVF